MNEDESGKLRRSGDQELGNHPVVKVLADEEPLHLPCPSEVFLGHGNECEHLQVGGEIVPGA